MHTVFAHLRRFAVIGLSTVLVGCASAQPQANAAKENAPQTALGYAIPIGGALKYDNDEVWSRIVQLAGGKGARFAVFATAAGNPDKSAAQIIEALTRNGAVAEHIRVAPRIAGIDLKAAVQDPALIAKVRASQGVYFSGGAQERIVDTLYPNGQVTPLLQAVWDVYRKGGVVAGSSAGAAIMSTRMFRDAQDVLHIMKNGLREGKEIDRGLGFVGPKLFVDQHFLKRGRVGRILPMMVASNYKLGIGVDENSAAIVRGDEIEVIGAKGALLVDLTEATTDPALREFNIKNARLTYLDRNDKYNLATRQTTPSALKLKESKIDPNAANYKPYFDSDMFYPDILGDTTIANAMGNLIDNKQREVIGLAFSNVAVAAGSTPAAKADLGFEFKLRKTADSYGYFTGGFGGEDYTVVNIMLDVTPIRMSAPLYRPMRAGETAAKAP